MSGRASKRKRALEELRKGFLWGYTDPTGTCRHDPPCHPSRVRCKPQFKQALAHACLATVLFFGGAVGGGKTEYAIVEAIAMALEHPGVELAIFRRFSTDLTKSVVQRMLQVLPDYIARYNKQDGCFRFWNGSIIWMCHCRYEDEVYRYQGLQVAGLFIDEASHFTEFMVTYLMTRCRSARGIPKRIRLTSNPGNVGHGWLKRWFVRPVAASLGARPMPQPAEVWRPLPLPGDPTPPEEMYTRAFIPARFKDNQALATADPTYLSSVYALGSDKAKQLADGDWDANDSMIVGKLWREHHQVRATDEALLARGFKPGQLIPWHIIPKRDWVPPPDAKIFGSVDYGYGAPWAFHLHAAMGDGHVRTFFEIYQAQVQDEDQAKKIRTVITTPRPGWPNGYQLTWLLLEPIMFHSRKEMGIAKSIAEVYKDELTVDEKPLAQLRQAAAGRSARVSRPQRWMSALQMHPDGLPLWTCTTACPDLIRTVPEVPWDPKDPEVEDELSENHCYEGIGRFFEARPFFVKAKVDEDLAKLDALSRAHHQAQSKEAKGTGFKSPVGGLGVGER